MDNKLTDNVIVKDFTEKTELIGAMTSVYLDEDDGLKLYMTMRNIFDLINRLQADCENYKKIAEHQQSVAMDRGFEIKRLKEKVESLQAENKSQSIMIKMLNGSIEDYKNSYINQKAEIERLKNAYKQVAWERDIFAEDMKQEIKKDCSYLMLDIKTIKAEAYKECIEKVKERSCKLNLCHNEVVVKTDYQISGESLDNLLKELVGEDNAEEKE